MKVKLRIAWFAVVAPVTVASAQGSVTVRRVPYDQSGGWNLILSVNRPVGGPTRQMKARLLEEGWTEHYCDVWKANCHDNPLIGPPDLGLTATISRRLRGRLDASMLFTFANLGSAEGRHDGTDVRADWSAMMAGTSIVFSPHPLVHLGAGPLLAFLNSSTTGDSPRTLVRVGALFEGGLRSSARKPTFVDLSVSYRLLGRRTEGPWPGVRLGFATPTGPSQLNVNFSHFSMSLGFGWRFTS